MLFFFFFFETSNEELSAEPNKQRLSPVFLCLNGTVKFSTFFFFFFGMRKGERDLDDDFIFLVEDDIEF